MPIKIGGNPLLKGIVIGFWAIAVTIGALYFSLPRPAPVDTASVETTMAQTEAFKTEYMAVALLDNGNLSGYLTGRARGIQAIGVPKDRLKSLLLDALHRVVYTGKHLDPKDPLNADFVAIATDVKNLINKQAGEQLIEQLELTDIGLLTHH